MAELEQIRAELESLKDSKRAEHSKKYLTSPYKFYGINVPSLRKIAKKYKDLSIIQTYNLFSELWNSGNHEEMSLALFLLGNKKKEFNLETWNFLVNSKKIEKACTWDLVDELSSHIIGEIFLNNLNLQGEIKTLADSKNPWIRRVSIVSQYPLIKKNKIQLTFLLAEKLVYDDDIYVQKAAGWMIREAGKKNPVQAQEFIKIHRHMKPQAFSYSTEKMLDLRKRLKEQIKQEEKEKIEKQKQDKKEVTQLNSSELNKIKYFKN